MKADIHPDYHKIKVVMTNGMEFETRSTYGKAGEVMKLDVDPNTHPAWSGGTGALKQTGQLDRYAKRFGGMSLKRKKSEGQ